MCVCVGVEVWGELLGQNEWSGWLRVCMEVGMGVA